MPDIIRLQGTVSHLGESANVYGAHYKGTGSVQTMNRLTFRVDGRPAYFESKDPPSLANGEVVTVCGIDKKGVFEAYAFRNENTGVSYDCPVWFTRFIGIAILIPGVLASLILIGIPLAWMGIKALIYASRFDRARLLLAESPRLAPGDRPVQSGPAPAGGA